MSCDFICYRNDIATRAVELESLNQYEKLLDKCEGKTIIFFDFIDNKTLEVIELAFNIKVICMNKYFYEFVKFEAKDFNHYKNKLLCYFREWIR